MTSATESITVRGLDAGTKRKLRLRAAEHGHSMEEEVRTIIREAVAGTAGTDLATVIQQLFAEVGGVQLELPPREAVRNPPDFSGPEYDPQ